MNGEYSFQGLADGTYHLGTIAPDGYERSIAMQQVSVQSATFNGHVQIDQSLQASDSKFAYDANVGRYYYTDRVIVKLKDMAGIQSIGHSLNSLRNDIGVGSLGAISSWGYDVWDLNGNSVWETIETLQSDHRVEFAEPDYVITMADFTSDTTPNDTRYGSLYGMTKIEAPEAWEITQGSQNVIVGVIDTGIDYTHPDLINNMWINSGEIAGNGIDDDQNGFVDDIYGYDFHNNDSDPFDDHGHGTHVAGTIAATGNNSQGVVGVSWNTQLMALKFLSGSGSGSTSNAIRALNYATMMGVDITNNSWGGVGLFLLVK